MNQCEPKYKQWLEILNHIHADYTPTHRDKERVYCWNKKWTRREREERFVEWAILRRIG
jgi:hypothetical protein